MALPLAVGVLIGEARADSISMFSTQLVASASISSTTFVNVTSNKFNMPFAGDALVLASLTADTSNTRTGTWQFKTELTNSIPISRYVSSNTDLGMVSLVHIFTNLPSGTNSLMLQHKVTATSLTTRNVSLMFLPLVTTEGVPLKYGISSFSSAIGTTNQVLTDIGLATSLTVPLPRSNCVFLAAALNSESSGSPVAGEWQLQYKPASSATWTDSGSSAIRFMSGGVDTGAVVVVTQVSGLTNGTYEFRVAMKSRTPNTQANTRNATLVAVSLSYVTPAYSGFFPSFGTTNGFASSTATLLAIPGAQTNTTLSSRADLFAMMSIVGKSSGTAATASYGIVITNSLGFAATNTLNQRVFSSSSDFGSGACLAVFTNLFGTYTVSGRHQDSTTAYTLTTNVNLVGFSSVSTFTTNQYTFQVISPYGVPTPAVGTYTNYYGTVLTNSVASQMVNGTQYVCTGWSMTGNVPTNGTSSSFSMTLTNAAVLTWGWRALQGTFFSFE
jgi:uncharacterized protein (DUF697 family)